MKQDFLGRSCEKSRGACNGNNGTERNVPNGNSCSIFSKPSLIIQVSGLCGRFSVMELIYANGKRDSGTIFSSPKFCLLFSQTANQPVCL